MLQVMKPHLSTTTQQQLVLTPQLRQAIHLLQLSTAELEAEVAEAVASNPLLDWVEDGDQPTETGDNELSTAAPAASTASEEPQQTLEDSWESAPESWAETGSRSARDNDDFEHSAGEDSLHDHLLWQLHLGHFSPRDTRIGIALIDLVIEDRGKAEPDHIGDQQPRRRQGTKHTLIYQLHVDSIGYLQQVNNP